MMSVVDAALPAKVFQSAEVRRPRESDEAEGILSVSEEPRAAGDPVTETSVPEEPRVRPMVELVRPALLRVPVMVGVLKVNVEPELVMAVFTLRPLNEVAEEVAKVRAPVCAEPYD